MIELNRDLNTKDAYFSYLLRIWCQEISEGSSSVRKNVWRVSLESTQTRTSVTFTSLEDLFFFLQEQLKPKDQTADDSIKNSM
jgi:hypothetical protein